MRAQQAAWEELPLGVQQRILVLTGSPCARRVSKACRDAFDAANDTLCVSHVFDQGLKAAATAAATRVVKNSASLTAVNFVGQEDYTSPPLTLSDLLAAGVTSGLATRLRKLTGIQVTAACAAQQLQVLRQCTGLTHLDISGSDLQGCVAVELRAVLQAMPRLMRLYMCSCKLQSPHVVAGLASALQPLTQLQHLHLAKSCLGAAGLAALAPALSAMPGLQTLDVCATWMLMEEDGPQALCTMLGAVPGLTHLDISHTSLHKEGVALLAAVLRGLTCLQTLNMSFCTIGDGGMAMLAPALAVLPHLHTLNLCSNALGASALLLLQPVLAREGSPLRELDLSLNWPHAKGAYALAAGLSTATLLRELKLQQIWGHRGWVALAPALSRLGPSLQSLQLGPDILDDAGSTALASALKALTGLTRLQAYHIFQSVAMVTISPALTSMQRLQVLDLHGASMGAEGTTALAAVLPALACSLKRLILSYCRIDVEGAANALAPALAQATGLVELRLNGNDFGPQAAHWLVPVLRALPHLRIVDLSSCKLGVQGCMAVARALKDRDGTVVDLRWNDMSP